MDNNAKELNLDAFKEIDNAFKFFNQVTTYDSIIQLPIMINRENTTGELYVMKRKRGRKSIDTDNFTLFLSLTTNSLGLVESFLNSAVSTLPLVLELKMKIWSSLSKIIIEFYTMAF